MTINTVVSSALRPNSFSKQNQNSRSNANADDIAAKKCHPYPIPRRPNLVYNQTFKHHFRLLPNPHLTSLTSNYLLKQQTINQFQHTTKNSWWQFTASIVITRQLSKQPTLLVSQSIPKFSNTILTIWQTRKQRPWVCPNICCTCPREIAIIRGWLTWLKRPVWVQLIFIFIQ